jgi:hypothetical protein
MYLIFDKHHIISKYKNIFVNIYYLGLIGMILINWKYGFIQDLDIKHNFSIIEKLNMLKQTYIDGYWIIFIIGSIYILYRLRIINEHLYKKSFNLLIYTLFLLTLYFMPLSALRRVELYFRSFIAIISSFTIVWINDSLNYLNKKIIISVNNHILNLKKFNMPIIFIFNIILLGCLIQPYLYYSNKMSNWSNLSYDEYLAAQWIKDNSSSKSYILTDPSTGKIFRGFTTRNCSTWFMINGQSIRGNYSLRRHIYEFFKEENPLKTFDNIERFPREQCIIVITTRTSSWIKTNINKTYCAPTSKKIMPFPGMEKFSTPFFTLLNSWDTVKIYELSEAALEKATIDG